MFDVRERDREITAVHDTMNTRLCLKFVESMAIKKPQKTRKCTFFKHVYMYKIIGHPQKIRVAVVGRDLWRSPSPTYLLMQVHLEQIAQVCTQAGFQYLQRRLQNLSWQPVPVLCHSHSKQVFAHIQMELPNLCLLPLVLSLGTVAETPAYRLGSHW